MHYAAKLVVERADANKEYMWLTSWEKSPNGKILKKDVSIAKNYLNKDEVEDLKRGGYNFRLEYLKRYYSPFAKATLCM